jgi:hypothetical protein|nr:MAG TPA: hypothetical protein [Caudoviricetes sp.]
MEKIYEMCLDIIKATLNKLEKDVAYEDIKEYLELKKIEVEEEKKKIKDPSSEYIDNLVKGLK